MLPSGRGSALSPFLLSAPLRSLQKATDTFGTRTVLIFISSLLNFVVYASSMEFVFIPLSASLILRSAIVSMNDFTRIPRELLAPPSSIFRMRGDLDETSFVILMISSDKMASCPQPKLTICAYSSSGEAADRYAPASILVWKLFVTSARVYLRSTSSSPERESTVRTGIPSFVNTRERSWLTSGSV